MTSPAELKEKLIEQYNQLIVQLQKTEGAIAACNELTPPKKPPLKKTPMPELVSRTGRVQSWIDNPNHVCPYPVLSSL